MHRVRAIAITSSLIVAACAPAPLSHPAPPATAAAAAPAAGGAGPCVGSAPPGQWRHVVWIVMENRAYSDVVDRPDAPYLQMLGAQCGLATDYHGIAHPSLPNYLALTSGSTYGISDDAGPSTHPVGPGSIFGLLGSDWRSLQESMPGNCDHSNGGQYAVKHNPAAYYPAVADRCRARDVPLGAVPDVSAAFTLITPDLCHDMHDCSTAAGDSWLAREVPLILAGPEYRDGSTALFVTWDENDSGGSKVATYVVAPSVVPGTRNGLRLDHYALLRATEAMLGLTPLLGAAATAADLRPGFHLGG